MSKATASKRAQRKGKALMRRNNRKAKLGPVKIVQAGAPSPDFVQAISALSERLNRLESAIRKDNQTMFRNASELKAGLDSAEFNLRAHQKVLNGITRELNSFVEDGLRHLDTQEIQVDEKTQLQVDWAKYHKYVEDDLAKLAVLEKQRDKEIKLQQVALIEDGILDRVRAGVAAQIERAADSAAKESELARASVFFSEYLEQVTLLRDGKDYDSAKLGRAIRLIFDENALLQKSEVSVPPPATQQVEDNEAVVFGG